MAERQVVETALVVIETSDSFVLHRRPDLPGKLSYPGKLHFFGGHVEEGETGLEASARELQEEVGIDVPPGAISLYAEEQFDGTGKNNELVRRHVTVGYLALSIVGAEQLELQEAGELVHIGKDYESFSKYEDDLTPFAKMILSKFIGNSKAA